MYCEDLDSLNFRLVTPRSKTMFVLDPLVSHFEAWTKPEACSNVIYYYLKLLFKNTLVGMVPDGFDMNSRGSKSQLCLSNVQSAFLI